MNLKDMQRHYMQYRIAANMLENPRMSRRAATKAAAIGWERKLDRWMKKGKIVTQLAPGVFTNADPRTMPVWTAVENADGTTTYVNGPALKLRRAK